MKLQIKTLALSVKDMRDAKNALHLTERRQWNLTPSDKSKIEADRDSESRKVNGSWRTIQFADHRATVEQYCRAENNGTRLAVYRLGKRTSKAVPNGYTMRSDARESLCLYRDSDGMDYHPSDAEIRSFDFAGMIASMERNARLRAEQRQRADHLEQLASLFERDARNTLVTLPDSRLAGNCVEGTLQFAERHGISREQAIQAPWLVGIRGDIILRSNNDRALAAALKAVERETLISI